MTSMASKPFSPAVQQFTHGTPYDTHRDLAPSSTSASSGAFRHRGWPASSGGTDDDFGRFAQHQQQQQGAWSSSSPMAGPSLWQFAGGQSAPARRDGDEILTMLGSTTLSDAVHANWEDDLLADQAMSWQVDSALPSDPPASAHALATTSRHDPSRGKGKQRIRAGDVSPTSTELLSSLSSLDLTSRSYLKTLLSLPPEEALEDYFSRPGAYTEDVYGLPADVQKLFEKAQERQGEETKEEGRAKAVRRLGMVMQHLWSEGQARDGKEEIVGAPAAVTSAPEVQQERYVDQWRDEGWGSSLQHVPRQRLREDVAQASAMQVDQLHATSHLQHALPPLQRQTILTPSPTSATSQPLAHPSTSLNRIPPRAHPQTPAREEERPVDEEQEEEDDEMLVPFSHFLQRKVDRMAFLGGRITPPALERQGSWGA